MFRHFNVVHFRIVSLYLTVTVPSIEFDCLTTTNNVPVTGRIQFAKRLLNTVEEEVITKTSPVFDTVIII